MQFYKYILYAFIVKSMYLFILEETLRNIWLSQKCYNLDTKTLLSLLYSGEN